LGHHRAIIGLYSGSTSQLQLSEAEAVTRVVSEYLVQPSEDNARTQAIASNAPLMYP
jgi:hypothetical protein